MTTVENEIYSCLQDDLSRQLFLARKEISEKWYAHPGDDFRQGLFTQTDLLPVVPNQYDKMEKIIIYGAGAIGREVVAILYALGYKDRILTCWDIDEKKQGSNLYSIPITAPGHAYSSGAHVIVCASLYYDEVHEFLISINIPESCIHKYDLIYTKNQYFDSVLTSRLTDHEVFVDAGCADFDNSLDLIRIAPGVKKIYAFELQASLLSIVRKRAADIGFDHLELHNAALYHSDAILSLKNIGDGGGASICLTAADAPQNDSAVIARSLDSVISDTEHVTFIKADIEGAEVDMLKGAANTIARCKPNMAICIYHKPDDYFELPAYIRSLVPEYKLYLRHYSAQVTETVLYCVI